jgi:hypothetical protein
MLNLNAKFQLIMKNLIPLLLFILLFAASCNKCYECSNRNGQKDEFCSEDVQNTDEYIKDLESQGFTCDSK